MHTYVTACSAGVFLDSSQSYPAVLALVLPTADDDGELPSRSTLLAILLHALRNGMLPSDQRKNR